MLLCQADARHLPFADGCVQTCVTSPPYWGLRDYGTAKWDGGDTACDHVEMAVGMSDKNTLGPDRYLPPTNAANVGRVRQFRGSCGKCGAHRIDQQLGLESTPDAYVRGMVAVFRQVRRVLRDDGTCWLNLGDSYAGGAGGRGDSGRNFHIAGDGGAASYKHSGERIRRDVAELKPKDLVGIPWRVAFALQADGWYLRSDIIWSKPNPMPESVTDRPTKAHEYVFLLAKSARYVFDADAVREPHAETDRAQSDKRRAQRLGREVASVGGRGQSSKGIDDGIIAPTHMMRTNPAGRNVRSVWHIATQPYPGAHFATMPEKLVERCVLAGSRPGDIVLDPFVGSGTVARVALRLGRKAIGCDLNPAYLKLSDDRTRVTYGLPFEGDVA